MTYFPDLSPYCYTGGEGEMMNIGWLDAVHPFARARPDPDLVQALLRLSETPFNVMRGVHNCELCDEDSPIRFSVEFGKGFVSLGMGEIHVRGAGGTLYSAPTLVAHYVASHDYSPPQDFCDAVFAEVTELKTRARLNESRIL